MKKIFILLLIVVVFMSAICFACTKNKDSNIYTIVAPDGAPSLALASFIGDEFDAKVVASTNIAQEAIKSDFAIVPANMGAKIFNENGKYKAIAVVTNGNMFLVSNKEDKDFSLDKLKGKMLYAIGQGSVPDAILQSVLKKANIDYVVSETIKDENTVSIRYCQDGLDCIAQLKLQDDNTAYGCLAEPAVTKFKSQENGGYEVADLQNLWMEATNSNIYGYAQAILICKSEYVSNIALIDKVIKILEDNDKYIIENTEEACKKIGDIYSQSTIKSLKTPIVARCGVKTYRAKDNVEYIKTTLDAVYEMKDVAVGKSVPSKDSGFYN